MEEPKISSAPLTGERWVRGLMAAAAIAAALAYLGILVARYLYERDTVPVADTVGVESFLAQLHRMPTFHELLYFPDSEHKPVFPTYVMAIDHFYFGSQALLPLLLSLFSLGGACAACLWRFLPAIGAKANRLAYLLIFPLAMFWPANRDNLVWPKQLHACLSIFCLCAVFAIAAGLDTRARERLSRRDMLQLAAMLALIFVGAFSFGWGLLATFVIAGFVLWRRWPMSHSLPVLAAVLATDTLYASVSKSLHPGMPLARIAGEMPTALSYLLRYIGSPFMWLIDRRSDPGLSATIIGEIAAAAGLAAAIALLLRPRDGRDRRVLAGRNLADLLLVFGIVSAVATMKARLMVPSDATVSRYLLAPTLFWLALLFRLAAWPVPSPRFSWLTPGLCAALATGFALATPPIFFLLAHRTFNERLGGIAAVMQEDVGIPPRLARNQDAIRLVFADYAANQTSVYLDAWPHWLGAKAEGLAPLDAPACQGAIIASSAVAGSTDNRIDGKITRQDGSGQRGWLAFANREGTVIGLGTTGVRTHNPTDAPPLSGFAGYIRGSRSDVAVIYGWFGGNDWCRLALAS